MKNILLLTVIIVGGCFGTGWSLDSPSKIRLVSSDPTGGGDGYSRIVTKWDYYVKTKSDLILFLKKARTGQCVYVDDNSAIDLSGTKPIEIYAGITHASGRGNKSSMGALIFSEKLRTMPMIKANGKNVRVTGLRLRGPDQLRRTEQMKALLNEGRDKYYSIPNSRGISSEYENLEVDNCEIWGWSHAAIRLCKTSNAHIHHNYIHHNQRYGLGYGVVLDKSDALIEANIFDWNRQAISATGHPGTSYEACYNLVGENASSHSFDMHGGKDRGDGTDIAGDLINIHHNTFKAINVPAIRVRGVPRESATIHHNCFFHESKSKAVQQRNGTGKFEVYDNNFGGCGSSGNGTGLAF